MFQTSGHFEEPKSWIEETEERILPLSSFRASESFRSHQASPPSPSFLSGPAGRRKTEGERERRFFQVSQSPPSPLIDRAKRRRRKRRGELHRKSSLFLACPEELAGNVDAASCPVCGFFLFRQVVPERFSVLELVLELVLLSLHCVQYLLPDLLFSPFLPPRDFLPQEGEGHMNV